MTAGWRRGVLAALGIGLAVLSCGPDAVASDLPGAAGPPAVRDLVFAPEPLYRPDRFEIRGGGFYHCCFVETGSIALGGEIVAPRLVTPPAWLPEFFIPRFHVGGVFDLGGGTSYGYAGLLFTYNLTDRIFFEPFVGVALTDGVALGDRNHNPIGCTTLIHSGGNIGYRLDAHWSVMATLDHVSDGNLCSRNVGINNYGAKVGYSF